MTQQQFTEQYSFDLRKDKIGGGSFGTVYKAYDNINDIEVAIKVSEVKFVGDKEFSLLEEYNAIKNLPAHANIANYNSVHRFESFQGIFDYALMQYYPLGNLSHYLKNNKVSKEDREKLVMGILNGIAFLHKNKVVHRDLKPSNILVVNRKGQLIPKITDFGLSKQASADSKGSRFTNSFAGGTLQYSSPEQIKGLPLKLNTDLWSFGAIAFEILIGNTLFETQSDSTATAEWQKEITNMILHEDVSTKLTDLDTNWQNAITACLQRDLSKRIQSTAAITGLLRGTDQFKVPTETLIPPISTADTEIKPNTDAKKQSVKSASATQPIPKPKQKKWVLTIAALVVVLLSFTGYKLFNTNTDTQVISLQLFEENGFYGYKLGDSIAIPTQFTKAHNFTDNQALVSTADSSYYINDKGNWVDHYIKYYIKQELDQFYKGYGAYENFKLIDKINYISLQNKILDTLTSYDISQNRKLLIKEKFEELFINSRNYSDDNNKGYKLIDTIKYIEFKTKVLNEIPVNVKVIKKKTKDQTTNEAGSSKIGKQKKDESRVQQRLALEKEDKDAYDKAKRSNTKTAYQGYLTQYPNGKFKKQVQNAVLKIKNTERDQLIAKEDKKWESALQRNSIIAYREYIQNFPTGKYVYKAKNEIKKLSAVSISGKIYLNQKSYVNYKVEENYLTLHFYGRNDFRVTFDVNNNNKLDANVDREYAILKDGRLCDQFSITQTSSTTCGSTKSIAKVKRFNESIEYKIPISEISKKTSTIGLFFHTWTEVESYQFFPKSIASLENGYYIKDYSKAYKLKIKNTE